MGHNLLKGKKGIIFGALDEKSIAWKTAEKCFEEGAEFVLTNAPIAMRFGEINKLAEKCNARVIPADVTSQEDLDSLFVQAKEILGGKVDFILHSVAMGMNVRKGNSYTDLNYDFMHKTIDISAMSFHRVIQTAVKHDMLNEWGSILALSYIAAQRVFPSYSEMADAKAMLESIARGWGYHLGQSHKVRVNTISQSPTVTTAALGVKGIDGFGIFSEGMSPLGNANAEACGEYCVTLFSDYTRMVTMQNLYHDGGFSSTGLSSKIVEKIVSEDIKA